ncbi:MAG: SLBB domain-containing protein [Chitinophagaceae bacterium]
MFLFKKFRLACLLAILILFGSTSLAQDILKGKDISQIKVDMLTDEEIVQYKQQLAQSGLSESQAEQLAIQRGFPASEIVKLRARLAKLDMSALSQNKSNAKNAPIKPKTYEGREVDSSGFDKDLKNFKAKTPSSYIFGGDLFTNENITFEPNLRIPTPKNYVIGPDDEINVDVYGYQEVNQKLQVSPEGFITLPYVGMINVSGLTVEQATKKIKDKMIGNGYSSIASGQSTVNISVGKIRSIKVTVIGEANKVGTFTLSSLATLFHALYAAGGPNEKGSLRTIEVIRNSRVIEKFDAYNFLMKGNQTSDVRLMDRDVIRIPTAQNQITLSGEIRKPAVFEILPNESLQDLITYAGGFTPIAYTSALHIIQNTGKEKQIVDVPKANFYTYKPQNGDVIEVEKIIDRFANKITIKGAVYRPGDFAYIQGLTLSKLIANADGLKPEAFTQRGSIIRLNEDFTKTIIPFNPLQIIKGTQVDIALEKNDEVTIGVAKDFTEDFIVTINGQVKNPGQYPFYKNQRLKDVIFAAGGFTEGASLDKIEVARRLNKDKEDSSYQLANIVTISSQKELDLEANDIELHPYDIITIRTKISYKDQKYVRVEGEVLYPSTYILKSKNERVSDLLKRTGGFTNTAFLKGAYITRINKSELLKDTNSVYSKRLLQQGKDSSGLKSSDLFIKTIKIGINVNDIVANENSLENIYLQEGDILTIPNKKREIKVTGEVLFPTEVVFVEGEDLKYYIERAGGYTDKALKRKVIVLQPNGVAVKTKKFLFFKTYPKVEEGSEILVPMQSQNLGKKLTTAETIGIASSITGLAAVVVAILNATK